MKKTNASVKYLKRCSFAKAKFTFVLNCVYSCTFAYLIAGAQLGNFERGAKVLIVEIGVKDK